MSEDDIDNILGDYATIYVNAQQHDWMLPLCYAYLHFLHTEDNNKLALVCNIAKQKFYQEIFHDVFDEYIDMNNFTPSDKRILDIEIIIQSMYSDNMSAVFLKPPVDKYYEWHYAFKTSRRARVGISFYNRELEKYCLGNQDIQNFLSIVNVTKCEAIAIDEQSMPSQYEREMLGVDLSNMITPVNRLMDMLSIIAHLDFIITCDPEIACLAAAMNIGCWYAEDNENEKSMISFRAQIEEVFPNLCILFDDEFNVSSLRKRFIAMMGNKIYDDEKELLDNFRHYATSQKFDSCFALSRNLIARHPMMGEIYKRTSDFYLRARDYHSAAILLEKIQRLLPKSVNNVHNLAIIWQRLHYEKRMHEIYASNLGYFIQNEMLSEKNMQMISAMYPMELLIEELKARVKFETNHLTNAKLLALCYFIDEDYPKALETYQRIINFDSQDAKLHVSLARCYRKTDLNGKAIDSFRKAITLDENNVDLYCEFGTFLGIMDLREEAIKILGNGLKLDPNNVHILDSLGATLFSLDRFDKAEFYLKRALSLDAKNVNVMMNLAAVLTAKGQFKNASVLLELGLALDPENVTLKTNLGMVLLTLGNYAQGWLYYSPRFDAHDFPSAKLEFPVEEWDGDFKQQKHILVWCEQGLGDQVMFSSLIPEMLRAGMQLSLDCDPRLVSPLQRSFPKANVLPKITDGILAHRALQFDSHSPNADVARHLRSDPENFSRQPKGFLKSHPALKQKFKLEVARDNRLVIGISWHTKRDRLTGQRSIPLKDMLSLFVGLDASVINLQYGTHDTEINTACQATGIDLLSHSRVDPMKELDNYLALMDSCNLIISIGNSTAHFAGALNKPCWVFLPFAPNWRWLLSGETCNWYSSLRLFRQQSLGDWSQPLNKAKHLITYVARMRNNKK